jgi:hypothetical protein
MDQVRTSVKGRQQMARSDGFEAVKIQRNSDMGTQAKMEVSIIHLTFKENT